MIYLVVQGKEQLPNSHIHVAKNKKENSNRNNITIPVMQQQLTDRHLYIHMSTATHTGPAEFGWGF